MSNQSYIPFQDLVKSRIYKLVNYGKPYTHYTSFNLIDNLDNIVYLYVDSEAHKIDKLEDTLNEYNVEIHYKPSTNKPPIKIIMTNCEIDKFIEKYGCKL